MFKIKFEDPTRMEGPVRSFGGRESWAVAFSGDSCVVGGNMAGNEGFAESFDVNTGARKHRFAGTPLSTICHNGIVCSIDASRDGRYVATGSGDNSTMLWDADQGTHVLTLKGHQQTVCSVKFTDDSRFLACGSKDYTASVWNVVEENIQKHAWGRHSKNLLVHTLRGHKNCVNAVAFSKANSLATASTEIVKIWKAGDGSVVSLEADDEFWSVAFVPDLRLATGSTTGVVTLWDLTETDSHTSFEAHSDKITSMACSLVNGDHFLATCSEDETAKVWDLTSRTCIHSFRHRGEVWSVAISPDGAYLATGSNDGENAINLWNITATQQLHAPKDDKPTDTVTPTDDDDATQPLHAPVDDAPTDRKRSRDEGEEPVALANLDNESLVVKIRKLGTAFETCATKLGKATTTPTPDDLDDNESLDEPPLEELTNRGLIEKISTLGSAFDDCVEELKTGLKVDGKFLNGLRRDRDKLKATFKRLHVEDEVDYDFLLFSLGLQQQTSP